jgi:hypothetical protein
MFLISIEKESSETDVSEYTYIVPDREEHNIETERIF